MQPFSFYPVFAATLPVFAVAAFLAPGPTWATGPRVSPSLFVPAVNEIFAVEQPPFVSATMEDPGLVSAIADAALKAAGVEAVVTTLPLRSIVKYHLTQEQAIAALGSRIGLGEAEKEPLVYVPLLVSQSHYVYYHSAQKAALNWDGTLQSLSGLRYGALKGEDASAFEAAGVDVAYGSERALLKKLKSGEVDFVKLTPLAEGWLLNKHFPDDKAAFAKMERPAGEVAFSMIFNGQHKNGVATAAAFKAELGAMLRDGRYAKIVQNHVEKEDAVQAYVRMIDRHLNR